MTGTCTPRRSRPVVIALMVVALVGSLGTSVSVAGAQEDPPWASVSIDPFYQGPTDDPVPVPLGAPFTIRFQCSTPHCQAFLSSVPVPPLPSNWEPDAGTLTQVADGDLLDTSTIGQRTVVVAAGDPASPTWLHRQVFDVQVSNGPEINLNISGTYPVPDEEKSWCEDRFSGTRTFIDHDDDDVGLAAECRVITVPGWTDDPPGDPTTWTNMRWGFWRGAYDPGRFTIFVWSRDYVGNIATRHAQFENVDRVAIGPGSNHLSSGGDPTAADTVNTEVQLQEGDVWWGMLIQEVPTTSVAPAGHEVFGRQAELQFDASSGPGTVRFRLHSSLLDGTPPWQVEVFHRGAVIPDCEVASLPSAQPDPCIRYRAPRAWGVEIWMLYTGESTTWWPFSFGRDPSVPPGPAPEPDVTLPTVTVTSGSQPLQAVYPRQAWVPVQTTCADPGSPSPAIASCEAHVVPGHPATDPGGGTVLWNGGGLRTWELGEWTVFATAVDLAGNTTVFRHEYEVQPDGLLVAQLAPGEEGLMDAYRGPENQVVAGITLPVTGDVRLWREPTDSFPRGYSLVSEQIQVEQPVLTAAAPALLRFRIPTGLLNGATASQLRVLRDGVAVANCRAASLPAASPDPCVQSRRNVTGFGVEVLARASAGGVWTFGTVAATSPDVPSIIEAVPGVRRADVTWNEPGWDGGAPISASQITATPLPNAVDPVTGLPVSIDPATGLPAVVRTVTVNSSATSGSVALSTGVSYEVRVRSRNAVVAAYGPWSDPVVVTPFGVPDPPTVTQATAGVRRVTLEWEPPSAQSPITGYTVVATPTGGGAAITRSVAASATSYVFSGLLNDTEYSFTVAARSAVGVSAPSDPALVARTPALPVAPVVSAGPGGSSAILSWSDAAVDADYPITRYTVTLSATRPDLSVHTVTRNVNSVLGLPAATALTVTGLQPGLSYSVTVTARNAVGTGPASAAVSVSPFVGLSVADVTRVEGTAATTLAVSFSVRLSSAAASDVTFTAQSVDGTAVAPGDYTAVAPTSFTIPAGSLTRAVTVRVVRDSLDEPDESMQLVVSNITGATPTKPNATLTIADDD